MLHRNSSVYKSCHVVSIKHLYSRERRFGSAKKKNDTAVYHYIRWLFCLRSDKLWTFPSPNNVTEYLTSRLVRAKRSIPACEAWFAMKMYHITTFSNAAWISNAYSGGTWARTIWRSDANNVFLPRSHAHEIVFFIEGFPLMNSTYPWTAYYWIAAFWIQRFKTLILPGAQNKHERST